MWMSGVSENPTDRAATQRLYWERHFDGPVEMGVLEDLTITSATSAMGIAFRLPRGGVGSVLGPGDGAENILAIASQLARTR